MAVLITSPILSLFCSSPPNQSRTKSISFSFLLINTYHPGLFWNISWSRTTIFSFLTLPPAFYVSILPQSHSTTLVNSLSKPTLIFNLSQAPIPAGDPIVKPAPYTLAACHFTSPVTEFTCPIGNPCHLLFQQPLISPHLNSVWCLLCGRN